MSILEAPVDPVIIDSALEQASRCHSLDMGVNDFLGHTGSDGNSFSERAYAAGYTGFAMAENVAAGQSSPAAVVSSWMNSTGHCNNIMHSNADEMGIGYVSVPGSRYTRYWTMKFGSR